MTCALPYPLCLDLAIILPHLVCSSGPLGQSPCFPTPRPLSQQVLRLRCGRTIRWTRRRPDLRRFHAHTASCGRGEPLRVPARTDGKLQNGLASVTRLSPACHPLYSRAACNPSHLLKASVLTRSTNAVQPRPVDVVRRHRGSRPPPLYHPACLRPPPPPHALAIHPVSMACRHRMRSARPLRPKIRRLLGAAGDMCSPCLPTTQLPGCMLLPTCRWPLCGYFAGGSSHLTRAPCLSAPPPLQGAFANSLSIYILPHVCWLRTFAGARARARLRGPTPRRAGLQLVVSMVAIGIGLALAVYGTYSSVAAMIAPASNLTFS